MRLVSLQKSLELLPPRCSNCVFQHDCAGPGGEASLLNCLDWHCCGGRADCDEVCPNNPEFYSLLAEVGGLRFDDLNPITQAHTRLPAYIPHLQHQYCRSSILRCPWVSVSPYQLLRNGGLSVSDGSILRARMQVASETRLILRGVDSDEHLERYWEMRRRDRIPEKLAELGVAMMIAPNFSHFGDVPRTDNLWNRRRQIICIEELFAAGLNVVPHLNDIAPGDWEFWFHYLRDNPTIRIIAKEFQTRCRARPEGMRAIQRLAELQDRLGRDLHPIIIGGAQFVEELVQEFRRFTVIDSRAVLGALNRHRFCFDQSRGRLVPERYLPGYGVELLAQANVENYERWIARRARRALAMTNKRTARRAG